MTMSGTRRRGDPWDATNSPRERARRLRAARGVGPDRRRLYGDLAWLWPIMSPPEHYREESAVYVDLLRSHARRPVRSVLHLGCGGGHIDRWLKESFAVTGLDLSPAMLGLARALNPEVRYLEGDMRTARLGEAFDAVCVFDSIDYMLDEAELAAAFRTAWEHLAPGGAFLTYAETLAETFEDGATKTTTIAGRGITLTYVEHAFDPDPADSTIDVAYVYLIREGARLRIETDRHRSGLFPRATWLGLLRETGFEVAMPAPRLRPEGFEEPAIFAGLRR
jgi:SAM-dependent methyltransferase